MKKPLLVHGVWCALAIASFVVGAQLFPASGDSSSGSAGSGRRADGKGARSAGQGESAQKGTAAVAGKRPSEKDGIGRRRASGAFVLSEQDVEALGEKFRTSASPIDRRLAFSKLLEGLTPENALLVRAQIEHLRADAAEFREFHYAWGAAAGVDAIMFGADTEKSDMSPALAGWASANPDEAMRWFDGLNMEGDARFDSLLVDRKIPAGDLRRHLLGGLVDGLADADPDSAARFVVSLAASGEEGMERYMHQVVGTVLQTGSAEEAAQWSEGLPAGDLRNAALGRVAGHYAGDDPQAAAAWAEQYAGQPEGDRMVGAVGSSWARRDPEGAIAWLEDLPESGGRSWAIGSTFSTWAERNPDQAAQHITQMPQSPERDSAISGFANRVVHENPAAGVEWADSISDPAARERTLINTGRVFYRRDNAAAQEWLATSGLSPEAQQQVVNPPQDRDRGGRGKR